MRVFTATAVLLSLSGPVMAQGRGTVALDAMTTPGRHFGFGYYVADRLSLRPSLGVSYSDQFGTMFNLGTDMRWELLRDSRVSPYATASFNYLRSPSLVQYTSSGLPLPTNSNVARYGGGVGLRARVKYGLSLVGEGRVMNSAFRETTGSSLYGQRGLQNGAHFEAAVGLSYAFN